MSDAIITVEGLSKRYLIGHQSRRGEGLRHRMEEAVRHPIRRLAKWRYHASGKQEEFWALKDVSLEVKRGEVVGIIGRNGAGKTTLLKLLSRITEPTRGRIHLKGRVASLLEVGTGFHPELTGRENIYLNGAILGMSKAEIRKKFDEIVAFSEVEKFLDTPVKRYSSGMYVRLAFAVAAHLEPEILVVDEVLAVGDADFQKKCLGKMSQVAGQGRTILFVSHNMSAVQSLCHRGVLLNSGCVEIDGPTDKIVSSYLSLNKTSAVYNSPPKPDKKASIVLATLAADLLPTTMTVTVKLTVHANVAIESSLEFIVLDYSGSPIGIGSIGLTDPKTRVQLKVGENQFNCCVKLPLLAKGSYFMVAQIAIPWVVVIDRIDAYMPFEVHRFGLETGERPLEQSQGHGCVEFSAQLVTA